MAKIEPLRTRIPKLPPKPPIVLETLRQRTQTFKEPTQTPVPPKESRFLNPLRTPQPPKGRPLLNLRNLNPGDASRFQELTTRQQKFIVRRLNDFTDTIIREEQRLRSPQEANDFLTDLLDDIDAGVPLKKPLHPPEPPKPI